ncbi:unnamed protein product [Prunus armeniaca]|uniref:Uncharacterized protein n=1 Tax=Prunus armeniaca TaxID=36596 RepID=A0A6J5TLU2_PRUAR|nr:unnamed protein product [Prunus armeniaca]
MSTCQWGYIGKIDILNLFCKKNSKMSLFQLTSKSSPILSMELGIHNHSHGQGGMVNEVTHPIGNDGSWG